MSPSNENQTFDENTALQTQGLSQSQSQSQGQGKGQGQPQQQTQTAPLAYQPVTGLLDDVYDTDGKPKPHWDYLLSSINSLGADDFNHREQKAQRILRDDGASYNVYSEGADHTKHTNNQRWELDLVPSLISSEEWGQIEAGLLERAELFNLLYKDLYGPRNLIRHGVIPPEALFCHHGFLRACQGISLPGDHDLILHGVDLMRGNDGEFCVMTDRTQSPSGAGYALENRLVMSRVMPSLFRDSHVHRLAAFFQHLRAKLIALAPTQDQPRIVVLTPGTHNETYFEHAYLANYLGFHLVQSADLVMRNGYVWMKSLNGLSRVDVILRRVDDWYCDPVELRSNSQLGVANLLEVIRNQRVVIANPLGSGVLENPILLRYLPAISKALIGRELRLKSAQSYWCGDKEDLAYVLAHLQELVIKPVNRSCGERSILASALSAEDRLLLIQKIQTKPFQYLAQPVLTAGYLPSYDKGQLVPKPAILRSFTVAKDSSYTVMPGGLTRIGVEQSSFIISNQVGSRSKDTWVVASEPERQGKLSNDDENLATREADLISLPSRVVENLFWMGRYAERAEASLRILRTVFMALHGEENLSQANKRILLRTVTELTATRPGFVDASDELIEQPEAELLQIITNPFRSGSVHSNLKAMLNCADQSKELLSTDMLRVNNDIRDALSELDTSLSGDLAAAPEEALNPLVTALMALSGLTRESMVRGIGWNFMELGRRLERALQTTMLTRCLLVSEANDVDEHRLIKTLLISLEVLISYRHRHGTRLNAHASLDLIMLDNDNPRSLLYQLERLNRHMKKIPKASDKKHELPPEERAGLEAETLVKLGQLSELANKDSGSRQQLEQDLNRLSELLNAISRFISDKYFDHKQSSHQLVRNIWDPQS